ncbi:NADH-quinone oxidoreductase subunit NuoG [Fimbriimonas ginsengisoli]|uniref:NADH-quinone oxidoreductase n=1 Tax=Fimbriimonas ginsengisoli Gsoil 348 TaxID=661478 RepID=A0A068NLU1_FIMGI|nr:NADH-quinone oxidoreductase subunit NuoG [Fimbriimonas ginsengisoli]AIE84441.1 NADH-quinone oxidoreductase subunit G [Fimbriimonas ginsengisoli Gsoil 348]
MAAVADVPLVNISINDVALQVPKGELIVESVKRLGLEVPIFCYHPRMKPVGMCRMCLIEIGFKQPDGSVRKMPKPQTACTLPASEGLMVYTDTQLLHNDRRGVLEFLLINHPLDCPICDRGGECPLQNNTLFYGPSTSRFVELKRHAPKAFPLSQYVTLDLERCIQCGRCVRFTEEISGEAELALRFRGAKTQPGTFELRTFESKFSGNVIEICPVGALTSSKYRFRARPWDLQTRPGICTVCSNGCNVYVDYRVDEVARINGRTNEAVNEEWTCDRGKFGHYSLNSDKRLSKVLVREGAGLAPSDWATAYGQILSVFQGGDVAALASTRLSNEDLFTFRNLVRGEFGSENLDHRFEKDLISNANRLENKLGVKTVQNTIADFETVPSILIFGTSLADEEPILFLRVRKAWFNKGTRVVVAHDGPTDADSFAHLILRYKPGTAAALANGLLNELVSTGKAQVPSALVEDLRQFTPEYVETVTGVPAATLREAAGIVAGSATITTRGIYDAPGGADAVETLAGLSMVTGGTFNNYARGANEEGATLLGVLPENGLNTHEILQACAVGKIKALWLAGVDPFDAHPDRDLVRRALENVDFLVFQHHTESEALHYASVVLPMTAPTEAEGSFTNLERRVQRFAQVLPWKGDAKPAWRVYTELAIRLRPYAPPFNPGEILARIAAEIPEFVGASYDSLKGEGFLLGVGPDPDPQDHTAPVEVNG